MSQAALKALPGADARKMAALAGRAIPMEFHFVLLRALALCYPDVFHVRERRPAPTRRSARVAAAER